MTRRKVSAPDWRDQRIAELEGQLGEAQATIAALKARIAQLEERLAESERAAKRQAAPFARDQHKADPKKPGCNGAERRQSVLRLRRRREGRLAGQGLFSYRARLTADEVDETKEARLDRCPECGEVVTDVKEHEQLVIDLPEIKPKITLYVSESGYCSRCGRRVRSRHPEQISEATGAAGVMI